MAFLSLLHTFQDITWTVLHRKTAVCSRYNEIFLISIHIPRYNPGSRYNEIFPISIHIPRYNPGSQYNEILPISIHIPRYNPGSRYNEIFPISIRCIQCCHTILNTLYHITSTMSMYRQYTFCANSPIFYITKN